VSTRIALFFASGKVEAPKVPRTTNATLTGNPFAQEYAVVRAYICDRANDPRIARKKYVPCVNDCSYELCFREFA